MRKIRKLPCLSLFPLVGGWRGKYNQHYQTSAKIFMKERGTKY